MSENYYESDKAIYERVYRRVPYLTLVAFTKKLAIVLGVDPEGAANAMYEMYCKIETEQAAESGKG